MNTLRRVQDDAEAIARALGQSPVVPAGVVCKPVLTRRDAILQLCLESNASTRCVGLITWMDPFSPAKMWIAGLRQLTKPFLHRHTHFNSDIPWSSIGMDFMNLNQSAHGGRDVGFI